jgi:protein associated with RNAse G/E
VSRIHVAFSKYDGTLHWHFDVVRLGEDEHGTWLGGGEGTPVQRGSEPPLTSTPFALLVPTEGWWMATFNPDRPDSPFQHVVYADICTPGEWNGSTLTATDLDLDVAMRADGTVSLLDEDEFDEHRLSMSYPPHVVDNARGAAAGLVAAMEARREPFASVGNAWLEAATGL